MARPPRRHVLVCDRPQLIVNQLEQLIRRLRVARGNGIEQPRDLCRSRRLVGRGLLERIQSIGHQRIIEARGAFSDTLICWF
jgi:hypothetical protein